MQESVPLPARHIPRRVHQFAEAYELGQPLSTHRRMFLYAQLVAILIFLGFLVSIIVQIVQLRDLDLQIYAQDKTRVAQDVARCGNDCSANQKVQLQQERIYLLGSDSKNLSIDKYTIEEAIVEACIPLLWLLVLLLGDFRKHLYICSGGLLYVAGRKPEALPWSEISTISWFGRRIVNLQRSGDRQQKFNYIWPMTSAVKISRITETHVLPRLLQDVRFRYQQQRIVTFGSVFVDHHGIGRTIQRSTKEQTEELVPWESLQDIRFAKGAIFLKAEGKWQRWTGGYWSQLFARKRIPNPTVCVALVKEHI